MTENTERYLSVPAVLWFVGAGILGFVMCLFATDGTDRTLGWIVIPQACGAPPMLCDSATVAPFSCRLSARPCSCKVFSYSMRTPVAPVVGTLLGGLIGAFGGALLLEWITSNDLKTAVRAGLGALCGAIGGKVTKILLAIIMFIMVSIKIF